MKTAANSISRLPRKTQDAVSNILHDGGTSREVSDYLVAQGYKSVTTQNVSNYRLGAHQAWVQKQERLEAIRADAEKTSQILSYYTENGGSPAEAGLLTAAEIMTAALGKISPSDLLSMMTDKPEKALAIIRELVGVAKYIAELKRPAAASGNENAKSQQTSRGLSADAMREIEIAAKLI